MTGGIAEKWLVPSVSLDWLLEHYPAPDVLKIDVDGAEREVFGGAERLLADVRPVILTEVFERNADFVTAILRKHRYQLFDYDRGQEGKVQIDRCLYNTLALPI